MKKNISILWVLFMPVLLFTSCSFKNVEKEKTNEGLIKTSVNGNLYKIDLDIQKTEENTNMSEIFHTAKIIPLETIEESLIGSLDMMQVNKGMLYILDTKLNKLFVFDSDGKFRYTIGEIGTGPGEYTSLKDFTIDTENDEIYLLDGMSKKIHKYGLTTNQYIESFTIEASKCRISYIQYTDGKMYYDLVPYEVSLEDSYLLQRMDLKTGKTDGSLISAFDYNKGWNGPLSRRGSFFFSRTCGKPKFISKFADTILAITNNDIYPVLAVCSKNWISEKDVNKFLETYIRDQNFDPILSVLKEKVHDIYTYIEYKDIIILEYINKKSSEILIYNTVNYSVSKVKCILDDLIYNEAMVSGQFICNDEKGVYGYIPTQIIPYLLDNLNDGNINAHIENIDKLKSLTEESNPVLFYYD